MCVCPFRTRLAVAMSACAKSKRQDERLREEQKAGSVRYPYSGLGG